MKRDTRSSGASDRLERLLTAQAAARRARAERIAAMPAGWRVPARGSLSSRRVRVVWGGRSVLSGALVAALACAAVVWWPGDGWVEPPVVRVDPVELPGVGLAWDDVRSAWSRAVSAPALRLPDVARPADTVQTVGAALQEPYEREWEALRREALGVWERVTGELPRVM